MHREACCVSGPLVCDPGDSHEDSEDDEPAVASAEESEDGVFNTGDGEQEVFQQGEGGDGSGEMAVGLADEGGAGIGGLGGYGVGVGVLGTGACIRIVHTGGSIMWFLFMANSFFSLRWWCMGYAAGMKFVVMIAGCVFVSVAPLFAGMNKAPLEKWLKMQQGYDSVYAEFVQTRKLATLNRPLVYKGRMWVKRPNLFLWKMGDPALVMVLRKGDSYLYLDKEKNEAVRMGADSRYARQFKMMTGDMGENISEFEKRFRIRKTEVKGGVYHVAFSPVNRQFRKRVPWLILSIHLRSNRMAGFEIHLEDKSVISTNFTRYSLNVAIPDSRFKADTTGYRVKRR